MSAEEPTRSRAMKVTTVRFGGDLWALLEHAAADAGVSVSQYVREAALARAAFAAGRRAGAPAELLAAWSTTFLSNQPNTAEPAVTERLIAALTRNQAQQQRDEASALRAESQQARRQAGQVRAARTPVR